MRVLLCCRAIFLFQFTPPCGGQQCRLFVHVIFACVSIHAPVRGATNVCSLFWWMGRVSIHAPVRGATDSTAHTAIAINVFQFTPPCGGQLNLNPRVLLVHTGFNSRPRAGGNETSPARSNCYPMFQFTPPCGGQPELCKYAKTGQICFNSRPRAGGNLHKDLQLKLCKYVSIHAPVRGATSAVCQ